MTVQTRLVVKAVKIGKEKFCPRCVLDPNNVPANIQARYVRRVLRPILEPITHTMFRCPSCNGQFYGNEFFK